ncbi:restriction endonuclease [Serpentinicella sp. ANB-PHB4]|uniref:restriction endonuclease n=1 Tax=Serpentinicella sp. ANB-PHB4 TaxID=3074076 RepID=UPI002861B8D9|nr:restriction endonuclease [Serpentinicella sp. ANB-PHB4]MDR5658016.1 restriction endonuclease [Serpentinicella sp. ANB-PHB4]
MKNINAFFQFLTGQVKGYSKNRSSSRRFNAYYMQSKEDQRNQTAKVFDYVLVRFMVFLVIFTFTYVEFNNVYTSGLTALVILTVIHFILIKHREKKLSKNKILKRKSLAGQKVYKELTNKTQEEAQDYIYNLLSTLHFKNIKFESVQNKVIELNAALNGERVNILFYLYKADVDVELKEVREFFQNSVKNEVNKGVVITTSDFTQDTYNFLEQLHGKFKLILINKDMLLRVIDKCNLFPDEDEIDEIIENKISKKERKWSQYKNVMFSGQKVKGYFLLSIYLLILSRHIPYSTYYKTVALTTLLLGLISLAAYMLKKKNKTKDVIDIDQLFNK